MNYLLFIKNKIVLFLGGALVAALLWIQYLKNVALRRDIDEHRETTQRVSKAKDALIKGVQNEAKKSHTRDHDFTK